MITSRLGIGSVPYKHAGRHGHVSLLAEPAVAAQRATWHIRAP